MIKSYLPILAIFLLLLSGCKKNEPEEECDTASFDRKEMVSHLTTQYILPAYDDYAQKTENLNTKVIAFTSNPDESGLIDCQNAWKSLAMAWQNVSFLEFGPAGNIGLRGQTNIYPVDTTLIHNNITSGSVNLGIPSNYVAKGIQSLDYLLFLPDLSSNDIVQEYENSTDQKNYLKAVCQELTDNAESVYNSWKEESTAFIDNTANDAQGSAVSNMVNALSQHYEAFTRKGKLGIPAGIFNGFSQTPLPGHTEALFSGYSVDLLLEHMKALKRFINGQGFTVKEDGLGLDDYMNFVSAQSGDANLSNAINDQIDDIIAKVEAFDTSINLYVISHPEASKAAYQSMQKLVPLIKVDLTSALGVLVTYQDNDGD